MLPPGPIHHLMLTALNHSLPAAAKMRLRAHAGKKIRLSAVPLEWPLAIAADGGLAAGKAPFDAEISVPLQAVPGLLRGVANQEVHLTGDLSLAADTAQALRHLEPDLEAALQPLVGDLLAHRLVRTLQGLSAVAMDTGQRLGGLLAEYLVEEGRQLADRVAVQHFCTAVDDVRDATERLSQRVQALEFRLMKGA